MFKVTTALNNKLYTTRTITRYTAYSSALQNRINKMNQLYGVCHSP